MENRWNKIGKMFIVLKQSDKYTEIHCTLLSTSVHVKMSKMKRLEPNDTCPGLPHQNAATRALSLEHLWLLGDAT